MANLDREIWKFVPLTPVPGEEAERQLAKLNQFTTANPDVFAGMTVNRTTRTVIIHYVASRTLTAWSLILNQQLSTWEHSWFVFAAPVLHSQRQLNDAMERITSGRVQPWTAAISPVLSSWYVDHRRNKVRIGVTQDSLALRILTYAAFGDRVELFRMARIIRTSIRGNGDMQRDGWTHYPPRLKPPFNGGQILRQNYVFDYSQCTSGFMVWNYAEKIAGLLTAGHCFIAFGNDIFSPQGGTVGGLVVRHWDGDLITGPSSVPNKFTRRDYAIVRGGWYFDPSVMVGPKDSGASIETHFALHSLESGDLLCSSGAFTGEYCDLQVITVSGCAVDTDLVRQCNLVIAQRNSGRSGGVEGDSGGPVYKKVTFKETWGVGPPGTPDRVRDEVGAIPIGWHVGISADDASIVSVEKYTDLDAPWEIVCMQGIPNSIDKYYVGCQTGTKIRELEDYFEGPP